MPNFEFNSHERLWLWILALAGLFLANGAFVYGVFFLPHALSDALTNPISAAFIAESFALMGALAYLLTKWGVGNLPWRWFIFLSLLGGMAFALPVVLLWPKRKS